MKCQQNLAILSENRLTTTDWQTITPNQDGDWINQRTERFQELFPLYGEGGIFNLESGGLLTRRDPWCYNFNKTTVAENTKAMMDFFNAQSGKTEPDLDPTKFSWTRRSLRMAKNGAKMTHDAAKIIPSMYRPFCRQNVYFHRDANDEVSSQERIYPATQTANLGIAISEKDRNQLLSCLVTDIIANYSTCGSTTKYLPRWTYRERNLLSKNPSEHYEQVSNISARALARFRQHYEEDSISEDHLFYYAYGVLHHQGYREKYADDLKKQPARIPMAGSLEDFQRFVSAGQTLAELHLNYESAEPYALTEVHAHGADPEEDRFYRVNKMRFPKKGKFEDHTSIIYNDNITLTGIPESVYDYRIGQFTALRWLIERYQVKTDKDSRIVNDPNDWCAEQGDPRHIIDLVKRVTTVSVKTMEIVDTLPELPI